MAMRGVEVFDGGFDLFRPGVDGRDFREGSHAFSICHRPRRVRHWNQ